MILKIITAIFLCLGIIYDLFPYNCAVKEDTSGNDQPKPLRIYNTTRLITEKPVIDGALNDDCWATGEWAGDFTQWIPDEGAKPSRQTHLKVLYDNKNIYVAIRAFDEPENITRKAGRRDEFQGDAVGINFDSYHDHRTGFEFNVTAYGQKVDLLLTNPSAGDYNWNAVWYVKTGIEDSAWTAEYEIPLSQLRYSGDDKQVWGLHCWRWIDRFQEESDWEPQSSKGPGMLYQFGELHGIEALPESRRIEIMPYSLGKLNTFRKEPGNPFANKGRSWFGNIGIDAKVGISSNFTADVSINPDFGQVESDPSVMNLSAFETFYDEKRPFFLEGKNIFSFDFDDVNIFYSRRIGHSPGYSPGIGDDEYLDSPDNTTILSAIKLSGKTSGGFSIGVLHSLTANEKAIINSAGIDRNIQVEPLTNYMIARVQQDFEDGNTVLGGILTSTNRFIKDSNLDFMNRNAFTGGLDFLHQWNDKEFFVDAKLAGSLINGTREAISDLQRSSARYYQRPDINYLSYDSMLTNLSGYGGKIKIGKGSKGLWRYSTELNWRSPGLDLNDLGFMQTADIVNQSNSISFFVNQPVSVFRTYSIGLTQTNNWDFGMNHLASGAGLNIYMDFLNKWTISTSINYTTESLDTRILRGGLAMKMPAIWSNSFYMRTDPSEKIFFDMSTSISIANNKSTRFYGIQPGISVMPLNTLKIAMTVNYSSNVDNLQYIDTKKVNNEDKYILAQINQHTLGITFRIDYNITPEFTIQYYGSPFASSGKYSGYKNVTAPRASGYKDRFLALSPVLNGNNFEVYDRNQQFSYDFENPDFNFYQFRSNLVLRWEYLPGSQIYLVWSNERTYDVKPAGHTVNHIFNILKNVYPESIFLVKINYWFSI